MKRDNYYHARIFKSYPPFVIDHKYKNKKDQLVNQSHKQDILQARGGFTIATLVNPDNTISWGFARCSEKDIYCKQVGRILATERATKNEIVTQNVEFQVVKNTSRKLAEFLYNDKHLFFTITQEKVKEVLTQEEIEYSSLV